MNDLMTPVDEVVQNILLSAIIGGTISEKEREFYSQWCIQNCFGHTITCKTCGVTEAVTLPLAQY